MSPTKVEVLEHYCAELYKSQTPTLNSTDDFLRSIQLPKLDQGVIEDLSSPITIQEIEEAVSALKANRALDLDEFMTEFYKLFIGVLAKHFKGVFEEFC